MARASHQPFPGFPDFQANVTFTPRQFFTVVLPHCSRGTVRIVGYALRKILGWVDRNGNPTQTQLRLSYRELVEHAGVSRAAIGPALEEAVCQHLLTCLQTPQPDSLGSPGQSGIFEICWDREGEYTDNPALFRGFIYREAIVVPEGVGANSVRRPTAARKNIPNAFFDYVLPNEKLSVIRVVGALLYYSIQWGPAGERKAPVRRSITELGHLTRLSRQHVHEALYEARRRGYVESTDGGFFDTSGGGESRSATYSIRWTRTPLPRRSAPPEPVKKGVRENRDRFKKVYEDRFKKVNGNRFKKVNDITIKTNNTKTTTTAEPRTDVSDRPTEAAAAAAEGFEVLSGIGYDALAAREIAERHPLDVIRRQVAWLALRSPSQNRLGLLRRAIEQDWPKPDYGQPETPTHAPARVFASHYYAAYHAYAGTAATEPLRKDMGVAERFIPRLLAIHADEKRMPEWGRRFGQMVRNQHRNSPRAVPNLSVTLVVFGDGFLRTVETERSSGQRTTRGNDRKAHENAFMPEYVHFLRQREKELQVASPALYEAFLSDRTQLRESATNGPLRASVAWLERFDREESRLLGLAEYLAKHPEHPIPGFWEWDATTNPQRFSATSPPKGASMTSTTKIQTSIYGDKPK